MSEPQLPPSPSAQATASEPSTSLANGEWHRMHPLTPLFKGGLVLIIVAGITIANMRDRLIAWAVALFAPEEARYGDYAGADPVEWVLANNLILVVLLSVLGLAIVLILIFWFVWRFQQFRITGDHVEVRKGIIFRSHRRAPLDRVQGVNLTRPSPLASSASPSSRSSARATTRTWSWSISQRLARSPSGRTSSAWLPERGRHALRPRTLIPLPRRTRPPLLARAGRLDERGRQRTPRGGGPR